MTDSRSWHPRAWQGMVNSVAPKWSLWDFSGVDVPCKGQPLARPQRLRLASLRDGIDLPRWRDEALCSLFDPELFFPSGKGKRATTAKEICAVCSVRQECLAYATAHPWVHGVWGGLTPFERRPNVRGEERSRSYSGDHWAIEKAIAS